jgi:hypothetical protein
MKHTALITLLFFLITAPATANEEMNNIQGEDQPVALSKKKKDKLNRRLERPVGVNLYAIGPAGLISGSLDGFITPKFALEAGAGLRNEQGDVAYFLGGRYHVFGKSFLNLTPYVGAYTAFHRTTENVQNHSLYVPFGLHKIKKSGFSWSAEIAYERSTYKDDHFSGGFKIGYRF